MSARLPAELWIQVFQYALADYRVDRTTLPTALSQSWWSKSPNNKWILRTPLDALSVEHRQRNILLKVSLDNSRIFKRNNPWFGYRALSPLVTSGGKLGPNFSSDIYTWKILPASLAYVVSSTGTDILVYGSESCTSLGFTSDWALRSMIYNGR